MLAEKIRIGLSLGLSGTYAQPAQMQQRAYSLWLDQMNARGGLLGRKVELVLRDDHSDSATATAIYREMIESERIDLILGPYSSAVTAAVAPITEEAGYPMLTAGAAADEIWKQGYRHVFGMWAPASQYSHGMLRLALANDLHTIGVLHADDEFSESVARGTMRWGHYLGLDFVANIGFTVGTVDLKSQTMQVQQAGAEVLIVAGHFDEAVNAMRALKELGWEPPAFFATVGPALQAWAPETGSAGDRAFATSIWESSVTYPGSLAFADAFRNRYALEPSYHAATAFAAGEILEAAVLRAGVLDRERISAVLAELDIYSVIGRYGVDRTGMQIKSIPLIVQWQHGQKVIVWPDTMPAEKPVFSEPVR